MSMDWYQRVSHYSDCSLEFLREYVHPDTICSCVEGTLSELSWDYLTTEDMMWMLGVMDRGTARNSLKSKFYERLYSGSSAIYYLTEHTGPTIPFWIVSPEKRVSVRQTHFGWQD